MPEGRGRAGVFLLVDLLFFFPEDRGGCGVVCTVQWLALSDVVSCFWSTHMLFHFSVDIFIDKKNEQNRNRALGSLVLTPESIAKPCCALSPG